MADPFDADTLCLLAGLPRPGNAAEREQLDREISRILEFFRVVQSIGTAGVEPLYHPVDHPEAAALRDDQPDGDADRQELLNQAPRSDGVHFLVPRVLG